VTIKAETMKQIKVVIEATLGFPDDIELRMNKNNILCYIKMNDLKLYPIIKFDGMDELAYLSDYDIKMLEIDTKIEELNADDIGIS
jgi:hypothetical protein